MSNPGGSNWTTNVNRSKTKRWVEAKSYSYDGDDWGDVDEYGEYDEPKEAPKPAGLRKATAPAALTSPIHSPIGDRERANSFDQEEERRAFSGPTKTAYAQPQPSRAQPISTTSQSQHAQLSPTQSTSSTYFPNPIAAANVMYDSRSASMTSANGSITTAGARHNPNLGRPGQDAMAAPLTINVDAPPKIGTPEKPATPTLIRPADIYRRLQEEREKERLSQDSSRPSLSGLARDESPAGKSDISSRQTQNVAVPVVTSQPLSTYNEATRSKGPIYSPQLPEIRTMSGFGDDFEGSFLSSPTSQLSKITSADTTTVDEGLSKPSGAVKPTEPKTDTPLNSNLQHQPSLGYKSVVNQAFDQAIPPTPSSTSGSAVDRSNSDSTSNISPIISREASTAVHSQGISNISSIIEEPAGSSRPGTAGSKIANPMAADVSDVSRPGHRRETSLPSASDSPARTPTIETGRQLVAPQEAEIAPTTPTSGALPSETRDRSSSPSKTKVRNLIDRIDSFGNNEPERPQLGAKESFRPSIPGAWQSYTTNPPTQSFPESEITPTAKSFSNTVDDRPAESRDQQFAKAAAAGSAMAGAFAAAAGLSGASDSRPHPEFPETPERASKVNTAFQPEATRLVLPRQDSDAPSSIVPTPLDMKPGMGPQSEYFASSATPRQESSVLPSTSVQTPQAQKDLAMDNLSVQSSPTDLESDRLRREIVRELSPNRDQPDEKPPLAGESRQEHNGTGYSAIYDSYMDEDETPALADTQNVKSLPPMEDTRALEVTRKDFDAPMASSVSGPLLDIPGGPLAFEHHELQRQFSWETPYENIDTIKHSSNEPEVETASNTKQDARYTAHDPVRSVVNPGHAEPEIDSPQLDRPLPPPEIQNADSTMAEDFRQTSPQIQSKTSSEPVVPQPQSQSKVPAFREIMAIQSTSQRIQVYEQTRETFAKMDTGLMQWIQTTITSLPEHEELLRNGGVFPPIVRATPAPGLQSQQGVAYTPKPAFAPSSSKTVKGKELLHTAGIFGGKANSAAKGLFAKGRSKWGRSSDKGSKRLRDRAANANSDNISAPSNQIENTWETDVSAPYFSTRGRFNQGSPKDITAISAGLPTTPHAKQAYASVSSPRSDQISPPTLAASDSPTLGRSNTTAAGSAVSPLSGKTSTERKRASLAQKRASMELPSSTERRRGHRKTSSVDSHRYGPRSRSDSAERPTISTELRARLTVHQNQMRSFGEEFPADLIIPAEYRAVPDSPKTPGRVVDSGTERTPTQADFPNDISPDQALAKSPLHTLETKKNEHKAPSGTLWLDIGDISQDHTFDGPASPDYALRKEEESSKVDTAAKASSLTRPDPHKHHSSFSFIQFDPMASEDLTLKNPVTPKRQSFRREHSTMTEGSERETPASGSSFADYPTTEDFTALPTDHSATGQSQLERFGPQDPRSQLHNKSQEEFPPPSQSSRDARSRSSMLEFGAKHLSKQFGDDSLEGPAVSNHEGNQTFDSMQRDPVNAYKRHSMLSDVRESRELHPDTKNQRKQNRKSLLGLGLGAKSQVAGAAPAKTFKNSKFSLVPSARQPIDVDTPEPEADILRPSLTRDRGNSGSQQPGLPVSMMEKRSGTFDPADTSNIHGEKGRRRRFSGLTSFINKAKPRIGFSSNLPRGKSPTSMDLVSDRKVSATRDQPEVEHSGVMDRNLSIPVDREGPLHKSSANRSTDARSTTEKDRATSKDKLVIPSAHIRNAASIPDINSNRDAVINKITAPPQTGIDYKSVYPPEFFGEQPAEGYYGPEDAPDASAVLVPGPRPTPVHSILPEPRIKTQGLAGDEKDQTRSQPPPLVRNDDSTHSTKTTTITLYNNRGTVKTTTETETTVSRQGSGQTSPSDQHRSRRITDSLISGMDTSSLNSPTMYTATTNTVTRIANGRSPSPGPRSAISSSMPPIAPLQIAKKSPSSTNQPPNGNWDTLPNQQSPSAESSKQRDNAPRLSLNTQTGSARTRPVQRISDKSVTRALKEPVLAPPSSPPNRALPHPLASQRSASSSAIPTVNGQGSMETIVPPRHSIQANTLTNNSKPKTFKSPEIARKLQPSPRSEPIDDFSMAVQPLAIRKSPDIGTSRTSSQERTETPNRNRVRNAIETAEKRHSIISSPFSPSSRASLHSPALKDSPTLPRPTRPQSSLLAGSISSADQPDFFQSNANVSTFTQTPDTMIQADQASTTSKTRKSDPTTAVDMETNKQPLSAAVPNAVPHAAAVLPTEPIEKGYDEPRVRETARESDESEEEIVMSSTAYPGQEWRPDYGYGGWDGYD